MVAAIADAWRLAGVWPNSDLPACPLFPRLWELTEAGFRRMVHAHSAGLDPVIGIDGREMLRFPAPGGKRYPA